MFFKLGNFLKMNVCKPKGLSCFWNALQIALRHFLLLFNFVFSRPKFIYSQNYVYQRVYLTQREANSLV